MSEATTDFNSPAPERLSSLLSGYDVETQVSSGISGTIYVARQLSLDRKVSIKVLPPEIGKDATLRAAFESEAKTMARLNDPNLVDVFDFGAVDGMLYIIMEYVPGRSLHEATHGSHVDQKESARLIADVCHGLHHAHQEGIVHRALQPKNILINTETQPKIVDFGLANLFANRSEQPTSPYAAPETYQVDGKIDHRADIYSAGMILYDLVVGRLPSEPYAPPSSIRKCCPELDAIIYKAIQPDPEKRYTSADDMADDLEEMLGNLGSPPTQERIRTLVTSAPGRARPITRPVSIPASSSSNSAVIVSLLVVAVLAGIILLIVNSSSQSSNTNKKITQDQSEPAVNKPVAKPPKPKPRRDKPRKPRDRRPVIVETPSNTPDPEPPENPGDTDSEVAETPEVDPTPPVEPEPPKPPEFDREEWLAKARAFMQKKGHSTLAEYDKEILKNIDKFERAVKRLIRKMDRDLRKPAEIEVEKAFEDLRNLGRLPDERPKDTPDLVKKLYSEAVNDQEEIDADFLDDFARLRITYIQGLDKQTSILRKEGNDEHADALDEEIEATQNDMERFIRILRGHEADPEPEEEKEED